MQEKCSFFYYLCVFYLVRKSKLSGRDSEIRSRLREARERLGLDQAECARQIGLKRSTLLNYELGRTPLRFEVALKFCRQFIVSEEWLATGRFDACHKASPDAVISGTTDTTEMDQKIFFRQSMDLLSEPAARHLPSGMRFAEAYDSVLRNEYARLLRSSFYLPRIIFSDSDSPELAVNLLTAINERFVILLSNEALRRDQIPAKAWRVFARCMLESADLIFCKMMQFKTDSWRASRVAWLADLTINPDAVIPFLDENGFWPVQDVYKNNLTEAATEGSVLDVKPKLPNLLQRLNQATKETGKMSELANWLDVPLASVSRWLSGKREPGGEITLRLLQWVEQQERQK